ncbi:MAG: hypothetical protein CL678_09335 [Bdellovibrionaceae bacterium]|nr:hypothetical protein [Pseudobdellovibrionaceae bacterium]|tara:strand:+ start:7321 stop:8592 length:1272 start_codon:yes stop_codon:yes gene_type:complete
MKQSRKDEIQAQINYRLVEKVSKSMKEQAVLNEQLQNSIQFQDKVIESLSDLLFVLNPEGEIVLTNARTSSILGYKKEDLENKPFVCLLPESKGQSFFNTIIEQRSIKDVNCNLISLEGEVIPVSFSVNTILKPNGETVNYVICAKDERDSKLLKELRETQSQLIESQKMASLGTMTAGIAHEINNPISYVMSNLGTLEDYSKSLVHFLNAFREIDFNSENLGSQLHSFGKLKDELDLDFVREDLVPLVEESMKGCIRVTEIVQGLKDFSKIDSGEIDSVSINDCLLKSIDSVLSEIGQEIKIETEFLDELPQIQCQKEELTQAFSNVIKNSFESNKDDVLIKVQTLLDSDNAKIEISDNGCGIPESILPQVFDPFFTTKTVGEGTGLGLSIAYGIIKNHGGSIEIKSKENQGTSVIIRIPLG